MKNDFHQNDNAIIDEAGWLTAIVAVQFGLVPNLLMALSDREMKKRT